MASGSQASGFSAVAAGLGASYRLSKNRGYCYVDFRKQMVVYTDAVGGTAAVTDAALNTLIAPGGEIFQVRVEQAFAGAAPQVKKGTDGLLFVLDAAAGDGISLSRGVGVVGGATGAPGSFVVGTDEAHFFRATLKIGTVANAAVLGIGFAKDSVPDAVDPAGATDEAWITVDNGTIKLSNRLNSGSVSSTSTTQTVADAGTVALEVRVSKDGKVKYLINDAAPTVDVTGFTFDTGDTIIPYFGAVVDATGADPAVQLLDWESGPISSRGLADITEIVAP